MEQESTKIYQCKYCGKKCKNLSGLTNHQKSCKDNPDKIIRVYKVHTTKYNMSLTLYCQYCGKACKNLNSLKQHECRCSKNPNRRDAYKDGVNLNTKGKARPYFQGLINITDGTNNKRIRSLDELPEGWYRGYTVVRKVPVHKHTEGTKKLIGLKVSIARRKGIAEGTITPNSSYKFTTAYIEFTDGSKKLLRSSYEIVVALYLDSLKLQFEYERIRLPYIGSDNKYHTYITDFYLPKYNHVIEVKGNMCEENLLLKLQALSNSVYSYTLISEGDIDDIICKLRNFVDIDSILKQAKSLSKTSNRYVYKLKHI